MVKDAVVVGSGIIGATVAATLRKKGVEVLVLDDGRSMAGTPPSGGHLRPSWFGGMSKEDYLPAMTLLDEVWELKAERFVVWPTRMVTTVHRVDTELVTAARAQATQAKVVRVNNQEVCYVDNEGQHLARRSVVVLATGAATELLPRDISLTAKRGVSFRVQGKLAKPFIRPWAPYKQVVAHQQTLEQIWVGDGTALLAANWGSERTKVCQDRCLSCLGMDSTKVVEKRSGLRPYSSRLGNNPCLLQTLAPRMWLATGAGKLGTIAAGWVAFRILKSLGM